MGVGLVFEANLHTELHPSLWILQSVALMLNDEHSPPRLRVNGPLSNNNDFHNAFTCPSGTPMNPAEGQCPMW